VTLPWPLDFAPVNGIIALVGSGEFTPAMDDVDRVLLGSTGRDRPRVAILPTASWPDGPSVYQRWMDLGVSHFAALGAEPVPVPLTDRALADDPVIVSDIASADLVYLSGGKPAHLLETLAGSASGDAILAATARGAAVAGCSAGAMVLGGRQLRVGARSFLQLPVGWDQALGAVPGILVVPHYDAVPEALIAPIVLAAPTGTTVVGIDEDTAAVGRDGAWQVLGRGRVTVWHGRKRERHREGSAVRF
jgi:cyanophycinase